MKEKDLSWRFIVHIILKILSWALFVILLLVAIFLLYYYIANKIYVAKGSGHEPKFSIYTIATGSMVPNINPLDAVINMKVNNSSDLKVGDIITFISSSPASAGLTITHRIREITEDENGNACFVTKGDANNIEDESCAKFQNIIGKVIIKIPGLGHIQKFLASGIGWLLFILIPALIIIARDIMKLTRLSAIKDNASKMTEKKKKNPKKEAEEKRRKEEIKRKLLNENKGEKQYYKDPTIKEIENKKIDKNNKQKRKKN